MNNNPNLDPNQRNRALTGAAMKMVGVLVLIFAIFYAAEWASYMVFSTFGSR